jgi:TolB-like protein
MKRCPKCGRVFEENLLKFCRSDGSVLVSDSLNEDTTMFFPVPPVSVCAGSPRTLPEATRSVAVLPFANLSTDAANEYFCLGLAQELVQALNRIENLRVAAPTSAFSFQGIDVDIREIGRRLNVQTVLEGSVRRSENRIRITVQLVSATTGYQLWSERYDRQMSETVDVKAEIALAVVQALEVPLRGAERAAVCKRHTENADAHQLYLQGLFHARRFTAEGFNAGVEYLNRAIAADPNYALAYAELANAYYHASFVLKPAESLVQTKAAAKKALELDGNLAEAHTLLAVVAANYDRMPHEAERGFRKALELAPNSSLTHQWFGCYLITQGRLAEAIAEFCRARDLDPLAPILSVLMSLTYFFARQPHKALKHARKAIALDDRFWLGHWAAALAHEQSGKLIEALGQLEKANECYRSPWIAALRGRVYAKLGRTHIAEAILDEINEKAGTHWVSPYLVATVYFALDEIDRGFTWLEKAFSEFDENLNYMAVDPVLDSCRSDPRFMDLLQRAGLDQSHAITHFVVPVNADCNSSGYLIKDLAR